MCAAFRLFLAVVFCIGLAVGVVVWATGGVGWWRTDRSAGLGAVPAGSLGENAQNLLWFPDTE